MQINIINLNTLLPREYYSNSNRENNDGKNIMLLL